MIDNKRILENAEQAIGKTIIAVCKMGEDIAFKFIDDTLLVLRAQRRWEDTEIVVSDDFGPFLYGGGVEAGVATQAEVDDEVSRRELDRKAWAEKQIENEKAEYERLRKKWGNPDDK